MVGHIRVVNLSHEPLFMLKVAARVLQHDGFKLLELRSVNGLEEVADRDKPPLMLGIYFSVPNLVTAVPP